MEKFISKVTLEDFKKINPIAYGREIERYEDNTSRLVWKKIDLIDEVERNCIGNTVIALYDEPTPEELNEYILNHRVFDHNAKEFSFLTKDQAGIAILNDYCYFIKYLTNRAQTFISIPSVKQVYSIRNNWRCVCEDGDSYDIPKSCTKNIYFIIKE